MWLLNKITFMVFIFLFFYSCSIPAPAYILSAPKLLQCSTDYNPENPQIATWSVNSCSGTSWIRFLTYISQTDFGGWVFYKGSPGDDFLALIQEHISNGVVVPSDAIVNSISAYTATGEMVTGSCEQRDDQGRFYATIGVNPAPQNKGETKGDIVGLNEYFLNPTFIVIPPLSCISGGTFVVTAMDFLNKSESYPSNALTLY